MTHQPTAIRKSSQEGTRTMPPKFQLGASHRAELQGYAQEFAMETLTEKGSSHELSLPRIEYLNVEGEEVVLVATWQSEWSWATTYRTGMILDRAYDESQLLPTVFVQNGEARVWVRAYRQSTVGRLILRGAHAGVEHVSILDVRARDTTPWIEGTLLPNRDAVMQLLAGLTDKEFFGAVSPSLALPLHVALGLGLTGMHDIDLDEEDPEACQGWARVYHIGVEAMKDRDFLAALKNAILRGIHPAKATFDYFVDTDSTFASAVDLFEGVLESTMTGPQLPEDSGTDDQGHQAIGSQS